MATHFEQVLLDGRIEICKNWLERLANYRQLNHIRHRLLHQSHTDQGFYLPHGHFDARSQVHNTDEPSGDILL